MFRVQLQTLWCIGSPGITLHIILYDRCKASKDEVLI
jgi:hypothetical protein